MSTWCNLTSTHKHQQASVVHPTAQALCSQAPTSTISALRVSKGFPHRMELHQLYFCLDMISVLDIGVYTLCMNRDVWATRHESNSRDSATFGYGDNNTSLYRVCALCSHVSVWPIWWVQTSSISNWDSSQAETTGIQGNQWWGWKPVAWRYLHKPGHAQMTCQVEPKWLQ